MLRDSYSNFGFFDAFPTFVSSGSQGDQNGNTLDLRGFDGATVVMNIFSVASAGAMGAGDKILFILQHGLASAAGVSTWSNVDNSYLIHSYYGGYDSTGTTGIFGSINASADVTGVSGIFAVGYKGTTAHRYLRVVVRNSDDASSGWVSGIAFLGPAANWPVNTPVAAV